LPDSLLLTINAEFSFSRKREAIDRAPTLQLMFLETQIQYENLPCMGKIKKSAKTANPPTIACEWPNWKDQTGWTWYSYKTVLNKAKKLAIGLKTLNPSPVRKTLTLKYFKQVQFAYPD
jgi:hypothetical protein